MHPKGSAPVADHSSTSLDRVTALSQKIGPAIERLEEIVVPATFTVAAGDAHGLINDIASANSNGQSNIIQLAAGSIYSLTAVNN